MVKFQETERWMHQGSWPIGHTLYIMLLPPRTSAGAPGFSRGEEAPPFRVLPLAGSGFWEEPENLPRLPGSWLPRSVMRRYASLARHCVDPVSLFNRQVQDAWSWHAPQGRNVNTPA